MIGSSDNYGDRNDLPEPLARRLVGANFFQGIAADAAAREAVAASLTLLEAERDLAAQAFRDAIEDFQRAQAVAEAARARYMLSIDKIGKAQEFLK